MGSEFRLVANDLESPSNNIREVLMKMNEPVNVILSKVRKSWMADIILDWCKYYRSDDLSVHDNIKAIIDVDNKQILFLMAISFSAGRKFQLENQDVDVNEAG